MTNILHSVGGVGHHRRRLGLVDSVSVGASNPSAIAALTNVGLTTVAFGALIARIEVHVLFLLMLLSLPRAGVDGVGLGVWTVCELSRVVVASALSVAPALGGRRPRVFCRRRCRLLQFLNSIVNNRMESLLGEGRIVGESS